MSLTGDDIEAALRAAGASTSGLVASTDRIAELFNEAMENYGVCSYFNDRYDVAALVSECMMESAWFRTTTEYTAGSNSYSPYDGRTFIQLTWESNYRGFGNWCHKQGLASPEYFVNNPHQLSDLKWAALGGVYYFTQVKFHGKPLTDYSHDVDQVGKAVNLGDPYSPYTPNGQSARRAAYNAVLAQGDRIVPDCSGTPEPNTGGDADDMAGAEHVKKHRTTDQTFKKADDYQWLKIDEDGADISFVTKPAKVISGVLYLEVDDLAVDQIVSVYGGIYDMRNVKDGPNDWYPVTENRPDRLDGVKAGWVHRSIPFVFDVGKPGNGWDYRALRFMIKSSSTKAKIVNSRAEAFVSWK